MFQCSLAMAFLPTLVRIILPPLVFALRPSLASVLVAGLGLLRGRGLVVSGAHLPPTSSPRYSSMAPRISKYICALFLPPFAPISRQAARFDRHRLVDVVNDPFPRGGERVNDNHG